jgi:hypothetical protein
VAPEELVAYQILLAALAVQTAILRLAPLARRAQAAVAPVMEVETAAVAPEALGRARAMAG